MSRIEEIKSTLGKDEEGAAEIRGAARTLERSVPVGEVLAAVADARFPGALIAAAQATEGDMERAWLTLAAAGPRRVRQVLAWRASSLLDSEELAALAMQRRRARVRDFEVLAGASDPSIAAAWRLLSDLRAGELRALVRARPALASALRRVLGVRGRNAVSPPRLALG